jgi:hypothetical protein
MESATTAVGQDDRIPLEEEPCMDKLARTESSPRRTTREERPVHPCTRDLVFSLATCGSLFVLGSWSLTAVGCSAQAKTNEQRTAQRRNMNPVTPQQIAAKESAKNAAMYKVKTSTTQPTYVAPATLTAAVATKTQPAVTPLTPVLDDDCNPLAENANEILAYTPNSYLTKTKTVPNTTAPTLSAYTTAPMPEQTDSFMLTSSFTKEKYYMPNGMVALRSWMPNPTRQWDASSTTNSNGWNSNGWNSGTGTFASTTRTTSPTNAVAANFTTTTAHNSKTGVTTAKFATNTNSKTGSNTGTATNGNTTELSQLLANAFAANSEGTMDPMRVWFVYASLAVSNPDIKLPEGWSTDLVPSERDRVLAAHAGFAALGRAFRDGATNVDTSTRQALIAALGGEPALTIPRVDLCSKVVGYGDYSPIGRRNFLVGSNNRVIVYSELDGFKSNLENGKWTTRLATRVSIVTSTGKESAWCRTPEWTEVVDTADNRRNEFFLGEIIPINSNLAMGTYFVKVEVKDLASGATTSSIVPFKVLDKQAYAAATDNSDID